MKIQIKLMGHLRSHAPPTAKAGLFPFDIPDGSSIISVLAALHFSSGQIHLIMRNGNRTTDPVEMLTEGDELTLFPPVAGG